MYKLTTTTDYYYHMKKKKTRERVPHEADAGREQKYATNPAAQRDTFLLGNQGGFIVSKRGGTEIQVRNRS